MTQTTLDRLRARGTVIIDADDGGYHVSWWPKGQKGNPFCGRGQSGPVLEPLIVALEESTRPPSRDWESARYARVWQEELDAETRRKYRLAECDRDDRRREKRSREREEYRIKAEARRRIAERERVRRVLA